jgi:hypothetical protein
VTEYAMRKVIVSPWLKTFCLFFDCEKTKSKEYHLFCFDRDRGIAVICEKDSIMYVSAIRFASAYNTNASIKHKFKTPIFGGLFWHFLLKIPSQFTFEKRDRYFVCVMHHCNQLEFIEFTDLRNIKTFNATGEFISLSLSCGFFWFKNFVRELNLPALKDTLKDTFLLPTGSHIDENGMCTYFEKCENIEIYNAITGVLIKRLKYNVNVTPGRSNIRFNRYLELIYNDHFVYYDLWSSDHYISILHHNVGGFLTWNQYTIHEINNPFLILILEDENKQNNQVFLIDLSQRSIKHLITPSTTPFTTLSLSKRKLNHITIKNNTLLLETFSEPNENITINFIPL